MKIAILGHSLQALEAITYFDHLGASITWYHGEKAPYHFLAKLQQGLKPYDLLTSKFFKWCEKYLEMDSALFSQFKNSWDAFEQGIEKYFLPWVMDHHRAENSEVRRVHKRFLNSTEMVDGRTRMCDLFRVVTLKDLSQVIKEQESNNPQAFEKFSEELKASLSKSLEEFEDFDAVIDMHNILNFPTSMGPGGHEAVGEFAVKDHAQVFYGDRALAISQLEIKNKEIALVGSGHMAYQVMIQLMKHNDFNQLERIFWITTEVNPMEKLFVEYPHLQVHYDQKMKVLNDEFENQKSHFYDELAKWQALEDYEKAKIPRPAEPISRMVIFNGHNITATDSLLDQSKLFLTLEVPDFRAEGIDSIDSKIPLKTVGVDYCLVCTGHDQNQVYQSLQGEAGFYQLDEKLYPWDNINKIELQLDEIKVDLMNFFMPKQ
jgi:hypothetical protein